MMGLVEGLDTTNPIWNDEPQDIHMILHIAEVSNLSIGQDCRFGCEFAQQLTFNF